MVIFLHSHSYLLAGYPQGSYSHGHRLALPGPARDHARKAPSMAAGGDNQKLVRIFDQAHRSAGLTASAAKCFFGNHGILGDIFAYAALVPRSEVHTSELQSLMRISYTVFCLKKQN